MISVVRVDIMRGLLKLSDISMTFLFFNNIVEMAQSLQITRLQREKDFYLALPEDEKPFFLSLDSEKRNLYMNMSKRTATALNAESNLGAAAAGGGGGDATEAVVRVVENVPRNVLLQRQINSILRKRDRQKMLQEEASRKKSEQNRILAQMKKHKELRQELHREAIDIIRQRNRESRAAGGGGGAATQQGGHKTRKNRKSSRRTRRR